VLLGQRTLQPRCDVRDVEAVTRQRLHRDALSRGDAHRHAQHEDIVIIASRAGEGERVRHSAR